jgi:hypothetical protein
MSGVKDTLGATVAEGGVLITLRADLPGGVSLGGDLSIEPGETKRLPAAVAFDLIHSGRAVRAEPVKAAGGADVSAPVDASGGPGNPPDVAPPATRTTRKRK